MRRLKSRGSSARRGGLLPSPALRRVNTFVRRSLVSLPAFCELSAECQDAFWQFDSVCRNPTPDRVQDSDQPPFAELCARSLRCELSQIATEKNGIPVFDECRTRLERAAAHQYAAEIVDSLGSGPKLARVLPLLARACGAKGAELRSGNNGLSPDGQGVLVFFPSPSAIPSQLVSICEFLKCTDGPPCYPATAAQVALLNLHPLVNGNGRASRLIFDSLIRQAYQTVTSYMPTYEQRLYAPYAFEVSLRSAELHGCWAPLARFYSTLLSNVHRTGGGDE